jgi:hypothetical protein
VRRFRLARKQPLRGPSWTAYSALSLAGVKLAGTVRPAMQDVVMLLFTAVFFALAFLYVMACQKLR